MADCKQENWNAVLDALRESGELNMFGAPQWLVDNFHITRDEAKQAFTKWTETYQ